MVRARLSLAEAGVERLAFVGQELPLMGDVQQRVQLLVQPVVPVIAGTVTSVNADIERFVSARRRGEALHREIVGIVGAIGFPGIGLELFKGGDSLRPGTQCTECRQNGGKKSFHIKKRLIIYSILRRASYTLWTGNPTTLK